MNPSFYPIVIVLVFYLMLPVHILLMLMGIHNAMTIKTGNHVLRLTWVIILIFIPVIGPFYYLFIGIRQLKNSV